MAIKAALISIGIALIGAFGCHKLCTPRTFSFIGASASVLPDIDSTQVGDTLWFSSSILSTFKYRAGGSDSATYDLSGAKNMETDIHLTALLSVNELVGAVDSFSFFPGQGNSALNPQTPHAALTISYIQENGVYKFNLGIIARKKGIYCLAIVDIYQAMKDCDKVSVTIGMTNPDSHIHYLKDIYYGGNEVPPIDSTHSYCFKVY